MNCGDGWVGNGKGRVKCLGFDGGVVTVGKMDEKKVGCDGIGDSIIWKGNVKGGHHVD